MRNIKFRGKHINYENWIYGGILQWNDIVAIIQHCDSIWKTDRIRVKPETVGQYTGYNAENGELYGGDLINDNMEVYWSDQWNAWAVRKSGNKTIGALLYKFIVNCNEDEIRIVGNIY